MSDDQKKTFPKPVDWDELYPGRFIKSGDLLGKKVTLTITDVEIDELEGNKGKQIKGIMSFREIPKKFAMNRTNGICIRAMLGRKLPQWVGKRITLFQGEWAGEEALRIWGSPDIEHDMDVTVELPRKKPFVMVMHKMPGAGAAAPATTPAPAPAAAPVDEDAVARFIAAMEGASSWPERDEQMEAARSQFAGSIPKAVLDAYIAAGARLKKSKAA